MSITFNYKGDGNINFPVGFGGLKIIPDSVAQSPQNQNLIYLFDPLYYNGYVAAGGTSYIAYLKKIYNRYPSILAPSDYVFARGKIINNNNLNDYDRKQYFDKNGFVFAYKKYNDDTDIPIGKKSKIYNKTYSRDNGVKERQKALLKLTQMSENAFSIFKENTSKTFSCFIKLKGPVQHRSTHIGNRIIREKKGIFLNTKEFSIGYRSPHYTRTGNINGYKFKFEPFSFVFGIKDKNRNHSFMTDFKFEFNKFYQLTITAECGTIDPMNNDLAPVTVKIYVNGELQNCAYMIFNPLYIGSAGNKTRKYRTLSSPIQPNFYKFDGTIFTPVQNEFQIYSKFNNQQGYGSDLWLGKSNLLPANNQSWGFTRKMTKRFLNNIDVGVIQVYNTVLSNTDIKKIYNTFGPRYQ